MALYPAEAPWRPAGEHRIPEPQNFKEVLRPQPYTYSSPEVSSADLTSAAASASRFYQAETRTTVPRVTNTIIPSEMPVT